MSRKSIQNSKRELFELLAENGESPDNISGDLSILCYGIKFTKRKSNNSNYYSVEDTSTLDDYYEINNEFILNSILETMKNGYKKIRGTTELCESMET